MYISKYLLIYLLIYNKYLEVLFMNNEFSQLEYNFENFNDYKIDSEKDVLIENIKDLSKKHNISFIEALGVFKYLKYDD